MNVRVRFWGCSVIIGSWVSSGFWFFFFFFTFLGWCSSKFFVFLAFSKTGKGFDLGREESRAYMLFVLERDGLDRNLRLRKQKRQKSVLGNFFKSYTQAKRGVLGKGLIGADQATIRKCSNWVFRPVCLCFAFFLFLFPDNSNSVLFNLGLFYINFHIDLYFYFDY